jgi:hypothetical protein
MPERTLAWLVTGPLGHLWSALADLTSFFVGSVYTRTRARLSGRT